MHIFIVVFMIVVIWSCLRSIGSSRRHRREYRKLKWERHLAETERRAALPTRERKRETDRNVAVFLLKAAVFVALAIAIFGQSLPYFWIAVGVAMLAGALEVHEDQRRAIRRGEQRRKREMLMQHALERAAAEEPME